MCAQRRLKSACAFAQSDQSLRCPHEETLHPWLSKMHTMKILIRLRKCAGWSKSSLCAHIQRYVFLRWGSDLEMHFFGHHSCDSHNFGDKYMFLTFIPANSLCYQVIYFDVWLLYQTILIITCSVNNLLDCLSITVFNMPSVLPVVNVTSTNLTYCWLHNYSFKNTFPADTTRWNNVDSTLIQRQDVDSTLNRRYFNGVCPLGCCVLFFCLRNMDIYGRL